MSTDPIGWEDPQDPILKKNRTPGGGGGFTPPASPPPGVVGGGYGSYFGSPTAGIPTFSSSPSRAMGRRDMYAGVPGFKPWMALSDGSSIGTDSVPAMLTPGEGVLNNGVMGEPGMDELVMLMNAIGAQRMAKGGIAGAWNPWKGFQNPSIQIGGGPAPPQPPPPPEPAPAQTPGSNPFGFMGDSRAPGNSPGGQTITDILNQFFQSGAFSPQGSAAVMSAVKENALGAADAARQRAGTLSVLSGADPASRANYVLQTDLAGQGGAAKAINDAVTGQLVNQQKFGQDQLSGMLQFLYNYWQSQQDYEHTSKRPGGI